jgi:hypothetical protein
VSPKDYTEFARECLGWAKSARSDRERRIFEQMAKTWKVAAALAEERERRKAGPRSGNVLNDPDIATAVGYFKPLTDGF